MRNEVKFLLKLKGLNNFVQIFDYKFEEFDLDFDDEEEKVDQDDGKPVKHLRVHILMEKIHGISISQLYN